MLVHVMDGDAGFFFLVVQNRFVYMHAIHAFAAVFGQKCRMNIDDFIREFSNNVFRKF